MRWSSIAASLTLIASLAVPADAGTHEVQRGTASWFTGRRGACGRLTGHYAAHRSLPCGTRIRVSRGGRTVTVVVRDRGPNVRGRVLDLSKSAFAKLARPSQGIIRVNYQTSP